MQNGHSGNVQPAIDIEEHDHANQAKRVNVVAGGAGNGAILDGVDLDIKATVFDLTNSNPLATQIVDASGTAITSFGGGTQYAIGAVAGATDTGTLGLFVRDDALGTLSDPDGDYTQGRTTSRGALWMKHDGNITADLGTTDTAALAAIAGVLGTQTDVAIAPETDGTISARLREMESYLQSIRDAAQSNDQDLMIDDTAYSWQVAYVRPTGFVYDTTPVALSDGNVGAARMDVNRNVQVVLRNSSDAEIAPLTDTQLRATAVPVTANAGTNLNTSALALEAGGNLAAIKAKTDNIPAQGQALAAASLPVVLTAAQITTLTPPAAITGFATSAKQDTLLTELQAKADLTETQPVKEIRSATGTRTQVADNAADVELLASNANRLGATFFNDSSATLYLGLGTTASSATNYTVKLLSGAYYEVPYGFTGQVKGIWASDPGDGACRVTELT